MQSLESSGLRVKIFAPHAPSFASATRAQPRTSAQDTLSEPRLDAAPIIYLHAL